MVEKHFTVDGEAISASLFDFGLYFFHNAHELVRTGTGPYFYLPKMESHLEARLWNDVFNLAQDYIAMPRGTIRGTVLIETIVAAFEMEEVSRTINKLGVRLPHVDHIRASRSQLWIELWSMGLYLQRDQEVPPKSQLRPARPVSCDNDCTIHGCICPIARPNMPQAWCTRHGK